MAVVVGADVEIVEAVEAVVVPLIATAQQAKRMDQRFRSVFRC